MTPEKAQELLDAAESVDATGWRTDYRWSWDETGDDGGMVYVVVHSDGRDIYRAEEVADLWAAAPELAQAYIAAAAREQRARELLNYISEQYGRLLAAHEQVVMDTPEDRELHDRAIKAFKDAIRSGSNARGRAMSAPQLVSESRSRTVTFRYRIDQTGGFYYSQAEVHATWVAITFEESRDGWYESIKYGGFKLKKDGSDSLSTWDWSYFGSEKSGLDIAAEIADARARRDQIDWNRGPA